MNSPASATLSHATVIHELQRRVRVIAPAVLKDQERAYILEILLKKRRGILTVRTVPDIASVAIDFDPKTLPKASLLTHLDALLGNLGRKKPAANKKSAAHYEVDAALPEREFNLGIEGMSCASCALLIEMVLKRDARIAAANVNYATETATVHGRIDSESLCDLIHGMGYRANSLDTLAQRQLLIAREKRHLQTARLRAVLAGALSLPVMLVGMAVLRQGGDSAAAAHH